VVGWSRPEVVAGRDQSWHRGTSVTHLGTSPCPRLGPCGQCARTGSQSRRPSPSLRHRQRRSRRSCRFRRTYTSGSALVTHTPNTKHDQSSKWRVSESSRVESDDQPATSRHSIPTSLGGWVMRNALNRAHLLRFFSSLNTAYAKPTFWNSLLISSFSPGVFPACLSGCNRSAARR
jgi:hypothetical protein